MRELIEEKLAGKTTKTKTAEPQRGAQIINLMDALKRSLKGGTPDKAEKPAAGGKKRAAPSRKKASGRAKKVA